ncbi:hypothetical protein RCIX533 [Methanocella arvoryzae MRE50]|uniref:Uncharacterized protein n=2 Tax=Methanocella TaxID=570266 RepID=Q0W6P3_METAR|nr:hypothetical protein RCIX533 [Methanocella arvoryzae MRE50]
MPLSRLSRTALIAMLCTIVLAFSAFSGCLSGLPVQGKFTEPRAYICQADAGIVSVLNQTSGATVAKIEMPARPLGAAVSRDGGRVYVSNGRNVSIIDARTNKITGSIPTRAPTTGHLAVSPDDKRLFVVCDGGLSIIDLARGKGNESAFVEGVTAMDIGTSKDGKYVFTTDWARCALQVTNTQTGRLEMTINLLSRDLPQGSTTWKGEQVALAGQAAGLDVSPDGKQAAVGIRDGSFVPIVDLQSLSVKETISLNGTSYQGVAYSPDGSRLYLAHYDGNRIVALDTQTYGLAGYIPVGEKPMMIEITPDGKLMYVTHEHSEVKVVSLPDGTLLKTLNMIVSGNGKTIAFNPAAAD